MRKRGGYRRQTPEERQAKVRAALERRDAQVAAMVTSDDWRQWLAVKGRFPRYSFGNCMLILSQCPEATRVVGYGDKEGRTGWKSLGRHVREGERAILIFKPSFRKREVEREAPETGEPETVEIISTYFRLVPVWDISQTDGAPLPQPPQPTELTGDSPYLRVVHDGLVEAIRQHGFTVHRQDTGGRRGGRPWGYTDFAAKDVVVRPDIDTAQAVDTLDHELAHIALQHGPGDCDYQRERGRCEVEAESVAYVTLAALAISTEQFSFPYVAGWSGGDLELVKATGKRVQQAADVILDAVAPLLERGQDSDQAGQPLAGSRAPDALTNHVAALEQTMARPQLGHAA